MPPPHPTIPPAASPVRKTFDPWNSSSTGHQRADNRLAGSTSWRDSRTMKLGHQFRAADGGGGKRVFDTVGAGSLDFGKDGRKENGGWEDGAGGLRERGWRDVGAMIAEGSQAEKDKQRVEKRRRAKEYPEITLAKSVRETEEKEGGKMKEKQVFKGLTIYINGSSAPAISDHKLKHLLASHGANVSLALGRRSVTHVILGKPNNGKGAGAGGGLAGSKIQKEISRVGGKGIKFVGVEWVIESVKAGKRLGEVRFETLRTAPRGVGSVYGMFKKKEEDAKMTKDDDAMDTDGKDD